MSSLKKKKNAYLAINQLRFKDRKWLHPRLREGRVITCSFAQGQIPDPENDMQLHVGIRKLKTRRAREAKEVGADWQVPWRGRGGKLIKRREIHGFVLMP